MKLTISQVTVIYGIEEDLKMSRDLIVYYSLEGNTEYVAEKIKEKSGGYVVLGVEENGRWGVL